MDVSKTVVSSDEIESGAVIGRTIAAGAILDGHISNDTQIAQSKLQSAACDDSQTPTGVFNLNAASGVWQQVASYTFMYVGYRTALYFLKAQEVLIETNTSSETSVELRIRRSGESENLWEGLVLKSEINGIAAAPISIVVPEFQTGSKSVTLIAEMRRVFSSGGGTVKTSGFKFTHVQL
ncbi:MAG: hypothetical protein RBT63_00425 [Bdellovibrionales bacterium]|jgi:hypothetical protein|nr:hypothetical protein [Bdellovibrionales bacterium]